MTSSHVQGADGYPPFRSAMLGLVMLMVACFFSFLDRQILSLLVQPIKRDLLLTDTQIGVLQGISFALTYSLMGLPFGWMADRFHRFRLITFGMVIWSLATIGSGFSNSFTELLIARVLVGAGEAALMPAAYSLLADFFPSSQRGRAFATFMSASILGSGGALVAGGLVLRSLSGSDTIDLPFLGDTAVWKAAFIIISTPGLMIALLLLGFREPPRHDRALSGAQAGSGLIFYMRAHPHAFFTILAAYSLLGLVGYAVNTWTPTLLIRNYGLDPGAAGMTTGTALLVSGLVGAAISGILGDRWTARGRRGGRLPLTFFFWIAGFPALVLLGFAGDVRWALLGFLVYGLTCGIGFFASSAVLQEMVPGHLRGRATAIWYLITGIIANGCGPVIAGVLNDHVFRSEAALPYSILAIAGPSLLVGLIVSVTGVAAYDKACVGREPHKEMAS